MPAHTFTSFWRRCNYVIWVGKTSLRRWHLRRKLKEEERNHVAIWEKAVQALGTASAKALRWDGAWWAQRTRRLEQTVWEGVAGKEVRKIIAGRNNKGTSSYWTLHAVIRILAFMGSLWPAFSKNYYAATRLCVGRMGSGSSEVINTAIAIMQVKEDNGLEQGCSSRDDKMWTVSRYAWWLSWWNLLTALL